MPSSLRFLASAFVVFAVASGTALASPTQLRFAISPNASDAVWASKGVKFEKRGECTLAPAGVPATATAPLFNPGMPQTDGTYTKVPDDGFNTLFLDQNLAVAPTSVMTCKGAILASGVVVSSAPRAWPSATLQQIAGSGPLTVKLTLDPAKMSAWFAANGKILQQGKGEVTFLLAKQASADKQLAFIDLDKGAAAPGLAGSEIIAANGMLQGSQVQLRSNAPAMVSGMLFSSSKPGSVDYASCKGATYDKSSIMVPKTSTSKFACMKTSEGHLAGIMISDAGSHPATDGSGQFYYMTFNYTVWE